MPRQIAQLIGTPMSHASPKMGSNCFDWHPITQGFDPIYLVFKTFSWLLKNLSAGLHLHSTLTKEELKYKKEKKILGVGKAGGRCNEMKSNENKTKEEHST